jgi:predicted nucleotide-binding protein
MTGTKSHQATEVPKAFIAHGGRSAVLDKLRDFIQALGIAPLIVELLPSKGMSVDDKVNKYIKDADCGIVLATKGHIVDKTSDKQHPRLNVIDEIERLRAVFPDRTILLLERGIALPSNIGGLTYEPFTRQSMDRAFTAIARELTAFGILKTIKPKL